MPICPLLSDFRTCYVDIVAERWAQGPGVRGDGAPTGDHGQPRPVAVDGLAGQLGLLQAWMMVHVVGALTIRLAEQDN
jgi:hypothetical protein